MSTRKLGGNAAEMLRGFVERIEDYDGQIAVIKEMKSQAYADAHNEGFDINALKELIKIRKKGKSDDELREYMQNFIILAEALGMEAISRAPEQLDLIDHIEQVKKADEAQAA